MNPDEVRDILVKHLKREIVIVVGKTRDHAFMAASFSEERDLWIDGFHREHGHGVTAELFDAVAAEIVAARRAELMAV